MTELSFRTRQRDLEDAASRQVDLLVVGGGITGAGIAWDAASRGMRTLLVERRDFASATSSRTSKMIHGGLRYLQNFQFSMVRQSLNERKRLLRMAPGLVSWLRLTIPLYRLRDLVVMRPGLLLYDAFAGDPERRSRRVDVPELARRFPHLKRDGLRGGLEYWDAVMNDARLTLAVVAAAAREGALVANYAEVATFTKDGAGQVSGGELKDLRDGREHVIRARAVVNATGPWVDELRRKDDREVSPRLRPNRGAHLLIAAERLSVDSALALFYAPGRLLFVIPWQGRVVLGTTEAEFHGDLDDVRATADEQHAILSLAQEFFPSAGLSASDVLATYAGVRPLLDTSGRSLSKTSREHEILEAPSGLLSVAGGKYTTFRRMAEEVVDRVATKLGFGRCRTAELSLEGALAATPSLSPSREEVSRAVREEMVITLSDLLIRRTPAALVADGQGLRTAEAVSRWLASELGWSETERKEQIVRYEEEVGRLFRPAGR